MSSEIKETIDFVYVINHALIDVYNARAQITWPLFSLDLEKQVNRYLSAVTSLVNLVSPVIGYRPDLGRAENLIRKGRYREGVKALESIIEELIGRLNELGLLFRSDRGVKAGVVRVGISGTDKEGYEE